jgi:succinoglycan biosynthesis transport protein ExoP
MEEEIDLRAYVAVLLEYKFWIAGLAVVAALVALGVSFVLPPTYEAVALVAITKPRYAMQFDPRVQTVSNVQPSYQAYPALAMGDEIVSTLIQDLGSALEEDERSVRACREMMEAENGGDPSIVELTVANGDPARAALIANRWAELFVKAANDLYGQSTEELTFFEAQLAEAEAALSEAEQDLVDFRARDDAAILEAQLKKKQASLEEYLELTRSLRLIVQDARSLRGRLERQDASERVSLSDELSSLLLEIDALRSSSSKTSSYTSSEEELVIWQNSEADVLPIQVQISGEKGLSDRTVGQQITLLDSLIAALEGKLNAFESEAESLEPGILSLQEKLQQVRTEGDRLELAKEVAEETFMTLSRKVAETRISAQDETGDVRLASRATVPDKPVSPRKLLNTAVAGALGLFVGVFGAFAIEYWRSGNTKAETASS